jgi:two-component system cell cycle response regulator CtrA
MDKRAAEGQSGMTDYAFRIQALEDELQRAQDRIQTLEEEIGVTYGAPLQFGLTKNEVIMFGVLMKREHALKSTFMAALYSDKHEDAIAQEKIIDVWICKMRAKLKPFGVEISTRWGQGYYLTPAAKAKARGYFSVVAAS